MSISFGPSMRQRGTEDGFWFDEIFDGEMTMDDFSDEFQIYYGLFRLIELKGPELCNSPVGVRKSSQVSMEGQTYVVDFLLWFAFPFCMHINR